MTVRPFLSPNHHQLLFFAKVEEQMVFKKRNATNPQLFYLWLAWVIAFSFDHTIMMSNYFDYSIDIALNQATKLRLLIWYLGQTFVSGGLSLQILHNIVGYEGQIKIEDSDLTQTFNEHELIESSLQNRLNVWMLSSILPNHCFYTVQHIRARQSLTIPSPCLK